LVKSDGWHEYDQFAINNPINYNDPTGAKFKDQNGTVWHHADPFADIPGLAGNQLLRTCLLTIITNS